MAETCPNAELCCICKEPSHRAWFCHFSWYCDVSPASSPAPQCHDTRQDTNQDTSWDMPLVANPPDPPPSSVAPSDRQRPLPARTARTFLTPKIFSFSVICLVMMMTLPVFFQIVKSILLMMIARIIMLMITMRMMMLMVMITTMKIMMMITMVMIWSLPKPVYRSLPLLALTQLLSVGPSLPLPTLFLPPPPAIVSLLQLNLLMRVLLISLRWNLSLFFPPPSRSHWPSQFSRTLNLSLSSPDLV